MPARILIMEDNPASMELMSYLLRAYGHTVLAAGDGVEGLYCAQNEHPDLIVCDVQMPKMDGYDVAKCFKRDPALCTIPLIAVTALAMVGDRDKVAAAGFDGYMPKPITPETFVAELENFLQPELRSTPPDRQVTQKLPVGAAAPRGYRILVVDDVFDNLQLALALFGQSGFEVFIAQTTQEALRIAQEVFPHLILSDVCMASGSGYEFIEQVKAQPTLRAIPFVFISSTIVDNAGIDKGLALGAVRYLVRPIDAQQLLAEIESCLRETA